MQGEITVEGLSTSRILNPRERDRRLTRRSLLATGTAGALAVTLPARLRAPALAATARRGKACEVHGAAADPAGDHRRGDQRSTMRRGRGRRRSAAHPTRMWTYGGTFPGPTIRRPAGERTRSPSTTGFRPPPASSRSICTAATTLPTTTASRAGLTSRPAAGLLLPGRARSQAKDSGNDLLIAPGAQRTYDYALMEDGAPERAAFQWYHDHRLERTGRNVWKGLAGMWILDDELDSSLPLPTGERDIPLMIVDRSFDKRQPADGPVRRKSPTPPTTGSAGPCPRQRRQPAPPRRQRDPPPPAARSTPPTSRLRPSSSQTASR